MDVKGTNPALPVNTEKAKALAAALAQIEKQFGKGTIMRLGEGEAIEDIQVVSTGSLGLDIALGVGGLPRGRVIEIYGPESSGKTTLTLQVIAEMQKQGGTCAFVDAEHALGGVADDAAHRGADAPALAVVVFGEIRGAAGDEIGMQRWPGAGDGFGRRGHGDGSMQAGAQHGRLRHGRQVTRRHVWIAAAYRRVADQDRGSVRGKCSGQTRACGYGDDAPQTRLRTRPGHAGSYPPTPVHGRPEGHDLRSMHHHTRLISHDSRFASHDSRLISHHTRLTSHHMRFISHHTRLISHHGRLASPDTRRMSPDTRFMRHDGRLMSYHAHPLSRAGRIKTETRTAVTHQR